MAHTNTDAQELLKEALTNRIPEKIKQDLAQVEKSGRKLVIFVIGPKGCGKTTLISTGSLRY